MNTNKQRSLIVALLFLVMGSCAAYTAIDMPVRSPAQSDHRYWESVHRGALLYANNCRTCHGNQGEGFIAPALNLSEWRDQDPLTFEENQHILRQTIQCGRAGTTMPAWLEDFGGPFHERQVEHLINLMTAPEEGEEYLDERGQPTNRGWVEALEFAHNLNLELTPSISGDTLNSIADQHLLGIEELAAANNVAMEDVDEFIPRGDTVQVPPNAAHPDGFQHLVRSDFDTIERLASELFVGAALIADLNNLNYAIDYGEGTFTLLDEQGNPLTGLMPGETLALPQGARYEVVAGDTVESIAEQHNVNATQIRNMNQELLQHFDDDEELDGFRRLELPAEPVVVVGPAETWDVIAERYDDLDGEALASLNNQSYDDDPPAESVLELPEDALYIAQDLDTFEEIATRHQLTIDELLELNPHEEPELFRAQLILDMPDVDAYVIDGQTFDDLAAGFGNVTGASLARANDFGPGDTVRVGTRLRLPDEAYGTAPADTINMGVGCVEHAVPPSIYARIIGEDVDDVDFPPDEAPEEFTDELTIFSYDIDWVFDADGEELQPNRGVVKIRPGTTVRWDNQDTVMHSVSVGEETYEAQFMPGDTFDFTFEETGRFQIWCLYHPEQDGYVFVEVEEDGTDDEEDEEEEEQ